jgi:hypothetical protein
MRYGMAPTGGLPRLGVYALRLWVLPLPQNAIAQKVLGPEGSRSMGVELSRPRVGEYDSCLMTKFNDRFVIPLRAGPIIADGHQLGYPLFEGAADEQHESGAISYPSGIGSLFALSHSASSSRPSSPAVT